jgi:hypothetical protein
MINMLLLVTNSVVFRDVWGGHIVAMEPVVAMPKFQSFSLHISFQASQNITVKVRVDRSVRRNNPFHVEKKNNEHALCCTLDLPHLFLSW